MMDGVFLSMLHLLLLRRLEVPSEALPLHGGMWAAVSSAAAAGSSGGGSGSGGSSGSCNGGSGSRGSSGGSSGGSLRLQAGWLVGPGRCVTAARGFEGDRLTTVSFTAAERRS